MKGYIAFVKKEFVENLKNYRFLILFAIFAIFECPVLFWQNSRRKL